MRSHTSPVRVPGNSWPAMRINAILAEGAFSVIVNKHADPIREEIGRLQDLGLIAMAARLEQSESRAESDVPDGCHWDPRSIDTYGLGRSLRTLELAGDELDGYLKRHAAGDIGLHNGPVAEASDLAIKTGNGLVRSRFDLYRAGVDDPQKHAESPIVFKRRRCPGEWIEACTILEGGKPVFCLVATSICGVHGELR